MLLIDVQAFKAPTLQVQGSVLRVECLGLRL